MAADTDTRNNMEHLNVRVPKGYRRRLARVAKLSGAASMADYVRDLLTVRLVDAEGRFRDMGALEAGE